MGLDMKYCRARSLSTAPEEKVVRKMSYHAVFMIMAGMTGLLIIIYWQSVKGIDGSLSYKFKQLASPFSEELPVQWDYSSFSFHPNESDWDEKRTNRTERHGVELQAPEGGRPRVLMATGWSPEPSEPTILSYLLLRAGKNKLDYCRIHDIEFFYNLGVPDNRFSEGWEKLPIVRMLMLQHPEVEWIWWMDADAILTNVSFAPPFVELEHYNLVLHGEDDLVYGRKPRIGLSTANFMIRNCQWSLDLLDAWASMGTAGAREESGKFLEELLIDRERGLPGDDQSGLVAMLAQDKRFRVGRQRWTPMVKLVEEKEFAMSANGTVVGPHFEELGVENARRVPFVTLFAGCLPTFSGGRAPISSEHLSACQEGLVRAFEVADNQVYVQLGFQPRLLGKSLEPMTKFPSELKEHEKHTKSGSEEFWIPPKYSDWDERRQVWIKQHPPTEKDKALIVSGSAPGPCSGGKIMPADGRPGVVALVYDKAKLESPHCVQKMRETETGYAVEVNIIVEGLKNVIDYARTHGLKFFYNNNVVDKGLTGWWSKLPLIRTLMLKNPSVEWIWWMDSDAVFTDMDYLLPFSSYDDGGFNIVMYGNEGGVFEKHSMSSINTGNLLIRNCQWSLDLLDRWASFGATDELRTKNVELLHAVLSDRPRGWKTDDQCVLVVLLITEREKWASKVLLENNIAMSGHWRYWVRKVEDVERRPFVTHFAGCKPCQVIINQDCMEGMDTIYNYADNQVLEKYGFRHQALNSSVIQNMRSIVGGASSRAEEGAPMGIQPTFETVESTKQKQAEARKR